MRKKSHFKEYLLYQLDIGLGKKQTNRNSPPLFPQLSQLIQKNLKLNLERKQNVQIPRKALKSKYIGKWGASKQMLKHLVKL